jgi:hypothetical protein
MSYILGLDTSSGRAVIPKELGWMEYSSSPAIASGLLQRYPDVEAVIQNGGLRQPRLEMLGCSTK